MEKRSFFCVTGLALLTTFALPQAALAGTDKAAEKATTATDGATHKKTQVLQQSAETKPGAAGPAGSQGEAGAAGTGSMEARNWAAIDINKDHYIQPEEMEKYLTDSWAAQKKAGAKAR